MPSQMYSVVTVLEVPRLSLQVYGPFATRSDADLQARVLRKRAKDEGYAGAHYKVRVINNRRPVGFKS